MSILELLNSFNGHIESARKFQGDDAAAVRTFTIYKDIIYYLVDSGKLEMTDDQEKFWAFSKEFTISAMYRVANNYRRKEGLPLLDFKEPAYHNKENKLEDWRANQ
ncbi:hypothetical protein [Salinicoccus sp. HZC-1]|uniref:hypothetical protein n=1 Tax=Salinicoccus sp. HZC-1 TaxID=3385497 RepID=UPI00398B43BE